MKWQSEQHCRDSGKNPHQEKLFQYFGAFESSTWNGGSDAARLGGAQGGKLRRQRANGCGGLPPELEALSEFGVLCVELMNRRLEAATDVENAAGTPLGIGPGDEDAIEGPESPRTASEFDGGDVFAEQGELG